MESNLTECPGKVATLIGAAIIGFLICKNERKEIQIKALLGIPGVALNGLSFLNATLKKRSRFILAASGTVYCGSKTRIKKIGQTVVIPFQTFGRFAESVQYFNDKASHYPACHSPG